MKFSALELPQKREEGFTFGALPAGSQLVNEVVRFLYNNWAGPLLLMPLKCGFARKEETKVALSIIEDAFRVKYRRRSEKFLKRRTCHLPTQSSSKVCVNK